MRLNFSEIFRERRGVDCLSYQKLLGILELRINIRVNFFKNWFGGPRSRGVQKFYEAVGVVDRGHRGLSNGVKIVTLRLLHLELNRILLKFLNLFFSS